MIGVGYRATLSNDLLNLNVGYCHTIDIKIPKGITVKVLSMNIKKIVKYDQIDR